MAPLPYSTLRESSRILGVLADLLDDVALPPQAADQLANVRFTAKRELPYFPIPLKETEVTAAIKAIEGCLAAALQNTKTQDAASRTIHVNLEKTTAFLFQTYLARIGGKGKLDADVKKLLKGT